MAFTRFIDDPCESMKRLNESTGTLGYILDPTKFYNENPMLIRQGIVAGNDVSIYRNNMVDLESDLQGRTRAASRCPTGKWLPGTVVQGKDVCPKPAGSAISGCAGTAANLVHLPTGRMINYQPRITTIGYKLDYPPVQTYGHTPKRSSQSGSRPARAWKTM